MVPLSTMLIHSTDKTAGLKDGLMKGRALNVWKCEMRLALSLYCLLISRSLVCSNREALAGVALLISLEEVEYPSLLSLRRLS